MEPEANTVSGDLGASTNPPSAAAPGPDSDKLQVRLTFLLDFEHAKGRALDVVALLDKLAKRCHRVVAQRRLWPLGKAVRLAKCGIGVELVETQAPASEPEPEPEGESDA